MFEKQMMTSEVHLKLTLTTCHCIKYSYERKRCLLEIIRLIDTNFLHYIVTLICLIELL